MNAAWAKYKDKPIDPTLFTVSHDSAEEPKSKKYVDTIYKYKTRVKHQDELEDYLSIGAENGDENVLSYWKQHANEWPNLSIMARDYLAATATSASSERGFSTGRDLLGITRYSMSPQTMEACICLRSWIRGDLLTNNVEMACDNAVEVQDVQVEISE